MKSLTRNAKVKNNFIRLNLKKTRTKVWQDIEKLVNIKSVEKSKIKLMIDDNS